MRSVTWKQILLVAAGVVYTDVYDWAEGLWCYLLSYELAGV